MTASAMPLPMPAPTGRPDELAQRGRIILDVAAADLETAERALGPFHPTTIHFRATMDDARRAWERLRAHHGGKALAEALEKPPCAVLTLGDGQTSVANLDSAASESSPTLCPKAILIVISGQTYCVERAPGTRLAPIIWRLSRLPDLEDGPYYACRLRDGELQCDCAQWIYQIADNEEAQETVCKHIAALRSLGWI